MQSYKYIVHGVKPSDILTSMYFVLHIRVVALLHKDPKDCMKKDQNTVYPAHVQNVASCFTSFRGML
jgi:hypothetical protein